MSANSTKLFQIENVSLAFSKPTRSSEAQRELFENYQSVGFKGLQLKESQYMPYIDEPMRFIEQWGHFDHVGSALKA